MSTIFINHSSQDNALARELCDQLHAKNYASLFLDFDPDQGIEAGKKWEDVLYFKLRACSVFIALISEDWFHSKWCFAEATQARASGKILLGLLMDEKLKNVIAMSSLFAEIQCINFWSERRTDGYKRLFEKLRTSIDPQDCISPRKDQCPFPGLHPFQREDAPFFYGRRTDARKIYEELVKLKRNSDTPERFLLVYGASGSGKSSLVRAGVLPYFQCINAETWIVAGPFRPSEGWPRELREHIDDIIWTDDGIAYQACEYFVQLLRQQTNRAEATVVLVIDQLEEALSTNNNKQFWGWLERLLTFPKLPLLVVATLRSDFMGQFQAKGISFVPHPVPKMRPEDFKEVIEKPALKAGINIETSLINKLVSETNTQEALPLLALALEELWSARKKDNNITLGDYDTLGGLGELIDQEAENTLTCHKLKEQEVLDAFLHLVRVHEGLYARIAAKWEELDECTQKVLEPFIDKSRLLVKSGGNGSTPVIIELAHEIVLNSWEKLKIHLNRHETSEFMSWRDDLHARITRYASATDKNAYLLPSEHLQEAKKWLKKKQHALKNVDVKYIGESVRNNKKRSIVKYITLISVFLVAILCYDLIEYERKRPIYHKEDWIPIKAGEFWMGSPDSDTEALPIEKPRHLVRITKTFKINRYEVTFDEYSRYSYATNSPSPSDQGFGVALSVEERRRLPVINVSYNDAVAYAAWLSKQIEKNFRLPTEAEWEYVARAGTSYKRFWGDNPADACKFGNVFDQRNESKLKQLYPITWKAHECVDNYSHISPVGSFKPNQFGVHDILGNVIEWTQDCFHKNYLGAPKYGDQAWKDSNGGDCSRHMTHGGSWFDQEFKVRVAYRGKLGSELSNINLGFRLVED